MYLKIIFAGLLALSSLSVAHPGDDHSVEALERRTFLDNVKRLDLSHCAERLAARGITQRNIERRAAYIESARAKRSIRKRELESGHNATDLGYTPNTDAGTIFAGLNSCILKPEATIGPYYVGGEYVRYDISEDQQGVETVLDYQIIDVNTCEPVPDLYLEIWHCNSTGVYSGVLAGGNGDSADTSLIDATFHRGIQATDADGVAQFETTFPGHYTGRTIHIHTMVHAGAQLLPNNTLGNQVNSSHVGQVYFDQDLITEVELLAPYNTNTQPLTTNERDGILQGEVSAGGNPFFEYTYLGDTVADGIFAWLAFGYNSTVNNVVNPAVFYYEEGGVANPNAGGGGPGGPGGPPPGFPSPTSTSSAA